MVVMASAHRPVAVAVRVVRREHARADRVQHLAQHRRGGDGRRWRRCPPPPARLDLRRGQAEDEDVVVADPLADLDVGAVERADGQRAVERQLHVAGARGLHAGGGNLLGQVGGRDDHLRQADVVVRQEHHLQHAAQRRVVVDHRGPRR